jgi:thiamine monophosphate kinase
MAAGTAIREALWLRKLLADLGYPVGTMEIKGDNQAALKLLENPLNMARSKHIDVVHHCARERVERGDVFFSFCPSQQNIADGLTKALGKVMFDSYVGRKGCA